MCFIYRPSKCCTVEHMKVAVLEVSNYSCSRDADWVFKNFKRYTHSSGSCVNLDYVTFDRGRTRTALLLK